MKRQRHAHFVAALIVGGLSLALTIPAGAQVQIPPGHRGSPQDWSFRHVVYANPDTREEAARKGTLAFDRWKKMYADPRFAAQVARKTRFVQTGEGLAFSPQELRWANRYRRDPPPPTGEVHRDWSNVLGGASGTGRAGSFPAKYGFSIDASPDCANDFVVFTTASTGADSSGAFASNNGTFSSNPTAGQTVTITHTGSPSLVLTASSASNLGRNFQIGATTTESATNLANAIARNGGTAGVTASSASNVVTVTSITAGATGSQTTLGSSSTNFTWNGKGNPRTLTNPDGSGSAGQPTVVAFNQLYSSCGTSATQAVPATYWSFNTGTGAVADGSPVLSIDGSQIAFVQRSGTAASLVVLKWSGGSGTVGAPTTLVSTAPASYSGCTAPCMTAIAFSGGANDTNSSPFYDYANDVLYVGDDNGNLHKFAGVFNATPTEVGTPVVVSAGNSLSSPVHDSGSGLVFVGSASSTTGGQLHSVNSSGTLVSSGRLATNSSGGVRDAPIVDSTAQRVYAFVGSDASGTSANCSGAPCMAVYQFPATFTNGSLGSKVQVGKGVTSVTNAFLYAGTFDNGYYASATPTNPSGTLYVCGSLAATAQRPTLWQIPIVNNAMATPQSGPSLAGATADCSAVTEIMNGTSDYTYASVTAGGTCSGGACIDLIQVTPFVSFDTTSLSSTVNSATARFMNISTPAVLDTVETNVDTALAAAQAGTYNRMIITQSAPSPSKTTFTYTLRRNASSTALTCSIAPGLSTCSDTTHTVALAANDLIDVQVARTGGTGNLTATFHVQLSAGGAGTAPNATLAASGGTSGIIIDNIAATAGASQIYYSTLANPGNAVQASQAGLQ